jgi:hypothetical protein
MGKDLVFNKLRGIRDFLQHAREKVFHEAKIRRSIEEEYKKETSKRNKRPSTRVRNELENNRDISAI